MRRDLKRVEYSRQRRLPRWPWGVRDFWTSPKFTGPEIWKIPIPELKEP
jgi:hypothetical protein